MARFVWTSDIHLDFLDEQRIIAFANKLIESNPDGILISGDISTADKVTYHLSILERVVQRPIYFVLGNHDYYNGGIEDVRKNMKDLSNMSQHLRYMPITPYTALTQTTAVLGHDGWYDGINGDWKRSNFGMSDWVRIRDFAAVSARGYAKEQVVELAQRLSREAVVHMQNSIKQAVRYHKHIVVLSHVPPFKESHIFQGKQGDSNAQPWFTSKFFGDMMLDASKTFPNVQFTVLAGHTHGRYVGQVRPNLMVRVAGAEYGLPEVQEVIDFP
jgi:predicted MPP superfamily phosphohydrolase